MAKSWRAISGSEPLPIFDGAGRNLHHMKQAASGDTYNALALETGWAGYCDPALHFDWPRFTELAELWHSLRGDAALPKREAVTARRLKDLLPSVALYERFTGPDGNHRHRVRLEGMRFVRIYGAHTGDRKSTRLNSSHQIISYAVFCLKKKK